MWVNQEDAQPGDADEGGTNEKSERPRGEPIKPGGEPIGHGRSRSNISNLKVPKFETNIGGTQLT
jgi:hypothetical protein